jgi:lipocalin-like protein
MRASVPASLAALALGTAGLLLFAGESRHVSGAETAAATPSRGVVPPPGLVGIWRVVRFCDVDQGGRETEPFGPRPTGYFIYAPSGELSIQVMRTPAPPRFAQDTAPTGEELRTLHESYFGYFGTFTITSDSTVVHHVIGGTLPEYNGTEQPRSYLIWGAHRDSLSIGSVRARACRLLVRVA